MVFTRFDVETGINEYTCELDNGWRDTCSYTNDTKIDKIVTISDDALNDKYYS